MALTGHTDEISRSQVDGWVFDDAHPNESVSVSIFVNGVHRGTCLASRSRPNLAKIAGGGIPTDCAFNFAFDPPLSPFAEHRVEVVETWSAEPLLNGQRTLPRPDPKTETHTGLIPILVTSTGRTGTTMLMSEFARHPDIVVGDRYPYEIKQVAYHAAAFRALVADADRVRSTHPDTMLATEMRHIIGGNPYNAAGLFDLGVAPEHLRDYYQRSVPEGYASLYRSLIQEFYATLAAALGKHTARYFSEKGDIDEAALDGARLFFGTVKEIVMVRDPRDLLCSAIAFWKLSPAQAMMMLRSTFPKLARIARHAGPDTMVVRYEDLIRDPIAIRRAISDFLGIDLLGMAGADGQTVASSHRTSEDAAASISRWRNDLTPEQVEECELAFGPSMRDFDYETSEETADRVRSFTRRRLTGENQIVAAEGTIAVSTMLDARLLENAGGLSRQVLGLTFGRNSAGEAFTLDGWSVPERDYVWSCAHESQLRLPPIRQPGLYELQIAATPFTHGITLPAQRVTILLNGEEAGSARVRDICLIVVPIPETVTDSEQAITMTLRFPDAARPSEVSGSDDDRLLAFSLHHVALCRIDAIQAARDEELGRPVMYVGAPVDTPPILTPEWRVSAAD
jgi:Sulfotransferase family